MCGVPDFREEKLFPDSSAWCGKGMCSCLTHYSNSTRRVLGEFIAGEGSHSHSDPNGRVREVDIELERKGMWK